jgi:hypothetical protein
MIKRIVAAVAVAAVVAGGGAYAFAQAQPDDPRPAAGEAPAGPAGWPARCRALLDGDGGGEPSAPARRLCRRGGLAARTVHADLKVKAGDGFANLTYDRGEVTAVSDAAITLRRPDGVSVTVTLTATTRYVGVGGADEVATGRKAAVLARQGVALVVAQRDGNYPVPSGVDGAGDQVPAA